MVTVHIVAVITLQYGSNIHVVTVHIVAVITLQYGRTIACGYCSYCSGMNHLPDMRSRWFVTSYVVTSSCQCYNSAGPTGQGLMITSRNQ